MKRVIALLLVICMLFSFCACSKIKSFFSRNNEQSFSYPIAKMPVTIDPQIASDEAELIIVENCMEGLVRFNPEGEIIPGIAQSWEVSGNGLQYTFHLNPNAAWAVEEDEDFPIENFQKQITAQDFVFAVSRAVRKETGAPDFQSVSLIKNALKINASGSNDTSSLGIKALDEQTLVITLESPNSDFLSSLTGAVFMPCNKQFFEYCAGRYGRQAKYFLSNAGFELRSWNETNIVLRKNESYALTNPSKADSVTLYRDENAFESFKNNNYDALAVSDDHIDEALSDNTLHVQTYDDTFWSLALNCESDFCASKGLRLALMQSVDTSLLSAPEWASSARGVVPNICTAGGENYRESVNCRFISFAPEKASVNFQSFYERYLEANDVKELPTFKFLCTAAFEQAGKEIVQSWQQFFGTGFEVKIEVLGLGELKARIAEGSFDAVIAPISADTMDALVFLKKFSSDNDYRYHSKAYNTLINSKTNERNKCLQCENKLLADALFYPLYTSNSYYVQRKNIQGIYFYAFGGKVNFLNATRSEG